ncbi:SDR family NAD(P)-dependent oxidoreductase [Dermatobacter hominis]|uniref:SDR family NAD(P)-dependent oxidoreductase n=1 Tax=Dermatobacter hominis TaxID=2884263 RepID=UPI001D117BC4|nr:SDR family NAD(P)-dependent oxidoreductase [Dermatobacter hominis]UDY36566.1 SDR family oxidoreductase [Dermatobacter hominis]
MSDGGAVAGVGRLAGRTAVVVGAGQTAGETVGNGRAVAITFAREGAALVLADRDPSSLAETARLAAEAAAGAGHELPAPVEVVVDISADDGPDSLVAAAVEARGGFDVLHNNVGIGAGDAPPHRLGDEAYDRIMDVNLRALWRTCRAAVPVLREQERSAIVNVSSLAAVAAATTLTAYKLSKAGVNALTQSLALSNARHGVRANAIMPGFIDTPMAVDAAAEALDVDRAEYAAGRAALVPLGRQGSAWDVANAALFLASDEAAFVTGVVLAVDGGQAARIG